MRVCRWPMRSLTESRMLLSACIRASRAPRSVLPLSPNIRSNSARGSFSIGSGVFGPRHEMVFVYAQLKPMSQDPARSRPSMAISSDASWVSCPSCLATS